MARVGVLGSAGVGTTLALGFKKHGHDVQIASREGNKLAPWSAEHGIPEGTFAAVAGWAEIVVLAVAGRGAESAVALAGDGLNGKLVIDTTNPIGGAPDHGILPYFTHAGESLMERLQKAAPAAHFVKAFSSVGAGFFVNPSFPGGRPTMFIAGNNEAAKTTVTAILDAFGWDTADVGTVEGARAIEPLCQLWCAPGFLRNQWTHAFKLLKL